MTGVNRDTGKPLGGYDHVVQCIGVILTTFIGERTMREWFGFAGLGLLGELGNDRTIIRFWNAVLTALTAKQLSGLPAEPRFRIVKIHTKSINRAGEYVAEIEGDYMPRGHLGDFTVEGRRTFRVARDDSGAITVL